MLLCHLSEAVAAPLSLPRRSEAKAGRGDSPKHGDSERIREQAPRRGYSAIQYFDSLLGGPILEALALLALPRLGDAPGSCVDRLLRVEIGVDEDEVIGWLGPEQLRSLSCLAHVTHAQFEQRSRP